MREPTGAEQRQQLAAALVDHALGQLAYFKAPGYVAFVDALPLTLSQKIQRGELRDGAGAARQCRLHRHADDEAPAEADRRQHDRPPRRRLRPRSGRITERAATARSLRGALTGAQSPDGAGRLTEQGDSPSTELGAPSTVAD